MDVDESDQENWSRNLRPSDHVDGKFRELIDVRTASLASATRWGRGFDGMIDRIDGPTNDVLYRSPQ